jgi:hypothetical protein
VNLNFYDAPKNAGTKETPSPDVLKAMQKLWPKLYPRGGQNAGTFTQWKIICITSMEVDIWGVKSSGCENSHATEVKFSNIPHKS